MNEKITIPEWGAVCVKLLQGPIYRANSQDSLWNLLRRNLSDINEYFSKIGVFVFIDDSDGYAFLKQISGTDEDDSSFESSGETDEQDSAQKQELPDEDAKRLAKLPRLIKKYSLSMELSLLCVILREALDQFDTSEDTSSMLVMKENDIKERLITFLPEKSDQTKVYAKMDEYLNRLVELTFLREIKKDESLDFKHEREFEVRRIIRAKVNAEFLEEFKRKLENPESE